MPPPSTAPIAPRCALRRAGLGALLVCALACPRRETPRPARAEPPPSAALEAPAPEQAPPAVEPSPPAEPTRQVVRVLGGRRLLLDGGEVVELEGVSVPPELEKDARFYLNLITEGVPLVVDVVQPELERDGPPRVYLGTPDGRSANEALVEHGYAYALRDSLAAAEERAKAKRAGLWRQAAEESRGERLRRLGARRGRPVTRPIRLASGHSVELSLPEITLQDGAEGEPDLAVTWRAAAENRSELTVFTWIELAPRDGNGRAGAGLRTYALLEPHSRGVLEAPRSEVPRAPWDGASSYQLTVLCSIYLQPDLLQPGVRERIVFLRDGAQAWHRPGCQLLLLDDGRIHAISLDAARTRYRPCRACLAPR